MFAKTQVLLLRRLDLDRQALLAVFDTLEL